MIDRFWILMDEYGNPIYTHKDRKRVEIIGNLKATAYVPEDTKDRTQEVVDTHHLALSMACILLQRAVTGDDKPNRAEVDAARRTLLRKAKELYDRTKTDGGLDDLYMADWNVGGWTPPLPKSPYTDGDPYEFHGVDDWAGCPKGPCKDQPD